MIPDDCAFLFAYRKKLAGKRLTGTAECQPLVETWPDKKKNSITNCYRVFPAEITVKYPVQRGNPGTLLP